MTTKGQTMKKRVEAVKAKATVIRLRKWTSVTENGDVRIEANNKGVKGKCLVVIALGVVNDGEAFDAKAAFDDLAKVNDYAKVAGYAPPSRTPARAKGVTLPKTFGKIRAVKPAKKGRAK